MIDHFLDRVPFDWIGVGRWSHEREFLSFVQFSRQHIHHRFTQHPFFHTVANANFGWNGHRVLGHVMIQERRAAPPCCWPCPCGRRPKSGSDPRASFCTKCTAKCPGDAGRALVRDRWPRATSATGSYSPASPASLGQQWLNPLQRQHPRLNPGWRETTQILPRRMLQIFFGQNCAGRKCRLHPRVPANRV